jgi:hypothetical protein
MKVSTFVISKPQNSSAMIIAFESKNLISTSKLNVFLCSNYYKNYMKKWRIRISERTKDGQTRAISQGKGIGRPKATTTLNLVQDAKKDGLSQSQVAKRIGFSLPTVKRH